ncbi:hypothetical protein K6119_06965 [Paracrocinitomix mangrovi]|uniref:hypothetical protein n=1 Tax=Paracrocinitomix mangrovi TaxID=2862509 RepID=UPI001C8EEAE8|nr:hypothetical protein [Paracrocinitomix mangrovi]UKN03254.1 hypothetical protein K6119_06965 [Paracrocinitomix mangrovi]
MRLIGIFILMFAFIACEKEYKTYETSFVTDVVVDSCTSVDVNVQATVETGAEIQQIGILWSMCSNLKITDPEDNNGCYEQPNIFLAKNDSLNYSIHLNGDFDYYGEPGFDPGNLYFVRPFMVIERHVYYGAVDTILCQ